MDSGLVISKPKDGESVVDLFILENGAGAPQVTHTQGRTQLLIQQELPESMDQLRARVIHRIRQAAPCRIASATLVCGCQRSAELLSQRLLLLRSVARAACGTPTEEECTLTLCGNLASTDAGRKDMLALAETLLPEFARRMRLRVLFSAEL